MPLFKVADKAGHYELIEAINESEARDIAFDEFDFDSIKSACEIKKHDEIVYMEA